MKHVYLPGNTVSEIQQALNRLVDQFGNNNTTSGTLFTLVFKPGSGAQHDNVYSIWSQLVTAAFAINGPKVVYFDDSLHPCVIIAGTWNLGKDTIFIGSQSSSNGTFLQLNDGAILQGVLSFYDLNINNISNSPVVHITNASTVNIGGKTTIVCQGNGPFFSVDSPVNPVTFSLNGYAAINHGVSPVFYTSVPGANISYVAFEGSFIDTNTIGSVVGSAHGGIFAEASAFISNTQVGLPGGVLAVAFWEQSKYIQYDDSLAPPTTGSQTVQQICDWFKINIVAPWPVADNIFSVFNNTTPNKLFHIDLSGQSVNTITTLYSGASISRPFRLPDISGTAVVQEDTTGFVFLGATTTLHGSASRVQLSSIVSSGAQYRANQYGPAGVPGISTFRSRGATVGSLGGVIAGDVLFRATCVGVAPDNISIPLAGFISIQVPSNFVPAGQNYIPSELEIQLVDIGINTRRPVFKVSSYGEAQTLRGVRAGGPATVPTNLSTGALWSSGSGDPNNTIIGSPGDLYSNTAGGVNNTLWVKESGVGTNTGWIAK